MKARNNGLLEHARRLFALLGAPLAWVLQMSLSEPLAANACHGQAALHGFWQALPVALQMLSLVCLVLGLLSCLAARNEWRDARQHPAADARSQFMARLALMSSFTFLVAIVFTACAAFLVMPCKSS